MSALARLGARLVPTEALGARVMERVRRRGAQALPYGLHYRQVFILPTLFGFGFGTMLVLMALGGLNFNNNLALLLVFIVAAIGVTSNLLTYRTLAGVGIESVRAEPAFAGEPAHLQLFLSNPDDGERLSLQAAVGTGPASDAADLAPRSGGVLRLALPTRRRGWLAVPPLRLETRHPLGLFRAWSWIYPEISCLVYPAPAADPPPLPLSGGGHAGRAQRGEGDQVHGLRGYRSGDSLHRVAWKTSARHDALYTREMETPQEEACVLDWSLLGGMGVETRLSVLTAWVLQADHRRLTYALQLPGQPPLTGAGEGQRLACLEALALHGA